MVFKSVEIVEIIKRKSMKREELFAFCVPLKILVWPALCYQYSKNKLYQSSLFWGVPVQHLHLWPGWRHKWTSSHSGHVMPDEYEQLSSESLEAAHIDAHKYMVKSCGKDGFDIGMKPHPFHTIHINKMSCAGTVCSVPLESPKVHIGQVIRYIHTKLQNKDHVIDALRRAKLSSLTTGKSTSLRHGALLSLMQVNLKTWWLKTVHPRRLWEWGWNTSLIVAPGTNDGPCSYELLGAASYLLMPTSKSYFLSKKKEREKRVQGCSLKFPSMKLGRDFLAEIGQNSVSQPFFHYCPLKELCRHFCSYHPLWEISVP